ncbi:MAG: ABC transporter permease [Actinobacteria bacterium]|jgi:spermidine/putrescine transport system permease protein|nr:MAG: ABC transporter permease [Actinomycetota bacterium]
MAVATREVPSDVPTLSEPRPGRRRRWTRWILPSYTTLVLVYLVSPILVMILYSFNNSGFKKVSFKWAGFTTKWYPRVFDKPDLTAALKNSLIVAGISTVIATAFGTLIALALVRYRFRGRSAADFVLFMNISAPEIVLGASLLSLFITFGVPRALPTIIIAHVMFNIAYVTVTVRARLAGFDRSLEEAAQDLGAGPWTTFWKVTFPIIFPGILAGALLAFALSIDDFVITNFNAGTVQTFPLWVYGAVKVGIPPQVFVMGTLIFAGGVLLAVTNVVLQRRKA